MCHSVRAHEPSRVPFLLTRNHPEPAQAPGATLFLSRWRPTGAVPSRAIPSRFIARNATYSRYGDVRSGTAPVGRGRTRWGVDAGGALLRAQGSTRRKRSHAGRASLRGAQQPGPGLRALYTTRLPPLRRSPVAIATMLARLLILRISWINRSGGPSGWKGAMAKLFSTEARTAPRRAARPLGADGGHDRVPALHPVRAVEQRVFLNSVVSTIYGGRASILREIGRSEARTTAQPPVELSPMPPDSSWSPSWRGTAPRTVLTGLKRLGCTPDLRQGTRLAIPAAWRPLSVSVRVRGNQEATTRMHGSPPALLATGS